MGGFDSGATSESSLFLGWRKTIGKSVPCFPDKRWVCKKGGMAVPSTIKLGFIELSKASKAMQSKTTIIAWPAGLLINEAK